MNKLKAFFRKLKIYLRPFLSWRFLVCYLIAWSWHILLYLGIVMGLVFSITWLYSFCIGFYGLLWTPFFNENFFQIPIAIWLNVKIFKNDKVTAKHLERLNEEAKKDSAKVKNWFKNVGRKLRKKSKTQDNEI